MLKLTILAASLLLSLATASLADFTFIQVSDTHIDKNETAFNARYNEAIKQINATSPAFIIHTGDALQGWSDESVDLFKKMTSIFSSKVYISPGNHDIPELIKAGKDKAVNQIEAWIRSIGYDRAVFTYEDCTFISLNSNLWNTGYPAEKEQFDWLKSELKKSKGKRIFIFQHSPVYITSPNEKMAITLL